MNAAPIFSARQPIPNPSPYHSSKTCFILKPATNFSTKNSPSTSRTSAVTELSAFTSDPAQPELTWQIVTGALAGVTPFVVAGIEFSKRIVAQKKCSVCKGSGLVSRDNKYYFRCPACDVCIVIRSLVTLDVPMIVDLIGIYVLKGPYCTLTTTNWFLQALSVIPRGSWGDVARRFTMIRWVSPKL
ncbi:hypothetical protein F511_40300 [Dorcoceras hygrometricum]|uniref:Uncharacterized protein n=1 Tax=Dorcoceras hygrometricum TaxID=472368 RepID=A0A2Z7CSY4_9LAMI|nr:hypothetical protein F511_40300 [Dorcoceras hygrometricum]